MSQNAPNLREAEGDHDAKTAVGEWSKYSARCHARFGGAYGAIRHARYGAECHAKTPLQAPRAALRLRLWGNVHAVGKAPQNAIRHGCLPAARPSCQTAQTGAPCQWGDAADVRTLWHLVRGRHGQRPQILHRHLQAAGGKSAAGSGAGSTGGRAGDGLFSCLLKKPDLSSALT